jgi:hypothetical protein
MNRRLPWLALIAGAYLAFVVATFPASTAIRWLAPPQVRTSGVIGTIWSGQAALASIGDIALSELRWTISPLGLLLLRVSGRAEARLADGFVTTAFSLSGTRVVLRELAVSTSLAELARSMPIGNATGSISMNLDTVSLRDGRPEEALGQIRIADLRVMPFTGTGVTERVPLGDYQIDLVESPNPGLLATIRDTRGPLEVDGRLSLSPGLEYELSGAILAREDAPRELADGLAGMTVIGMAGEPDIDGRREITFTGSL